MTPIVNTHQAAAWNGYEGRHWADHQDRYDAVNSAFNAPLFEAAAVGDTERVLDVGCGCGQTTRLAARRAVRGSASGLDLSAPMLARARHTAEQEAVPNVRFEQGDAQVHPFPDGGFDVAISRFGIMFFADPVAGFANIRQALRPGGRLAFLSLRPMRDSDLGGIFEAVWQHVPTRKDDAPDQPGPESLADPDRVRNLLAAAGFEGVRCTPVDAPQMWGQDAKDAADFLGNWGPVRHHLDSVDAETVRRARAALLEALRRYEQAGAVRTRGTAWLVTADRPDWSVGPVRPDEPH